MATWKRLALERFPAWATEVEQADRVGLSLLLQDHLVRALEHEDHVVAQEIARYAAWAWSEGSKNEPLVCMALDILSQAVRRERLRLSLWRALPSHLFTTLLPSFSEVLQRDASQELEREYRHTAR
jgi:hypothetical protein